MLMAVLALQKKIFSISFTKGKTKFCLSLDYNGDNIICLLTEKESITLKLRKKCCLFNSINKSDIINIYKYLMVKRAKCSDFLNF